MKRVVRLITQQARASVVRRNASTKVFPPLDTFVRRHIDTNEQAINSMLQVVGVQTVDELIDKTVPSSIRAAPLPLPNELKGEQQVLSELQKIAKKNKVYKSYIGMGYNGTILPPVIQRNILENPGWYTQYTPYQAEISQGRLESLLNFQTMIQDLTGLPIANASLLDEATAAAEAMNLCFNGAKSEVAAFFVSQDCHPQTIALIKTRAEPLNITVHVGNHETFDFTANPVCGAMIQYPTTTGTVHDYKQFVDRVHASGALVVCAADILSLALLTPPGEFGVDIALGSSQRFGVPMGYGGPHAAYLAVKDAFKRVIPGRIIGVSKDAHGNQAYRMALQTREQHIRREKATSNICTAQALLANISAMYAVYHGPEGVKRIAADVHKKALVIAEAARRLGHTVGNEVIFDTVKIQLNASVSAQQMADFAVANEINIRTFSSDSITISVDEATTEEDIVNLINVIAMGKNTGFTLQELAAAPSPANSIAASSLARTSAYLTHPIFNMYHTEHELLRYLHRLQTKDLSLTTSMIALGSCTMKLNATVEMMPITWPEFANIHPFVPKDQATGYLEMFKTLEEQLCAITGFHAMTLQPNAGSQGEYAGLLVIRKYLASIGQGHRNICLIPVSAHGTNPASAVMAGMKVVTVECNADGDISMTDLKAKAEKYSDKLAAVMVTYPSTHGVFEETIREVCEIIHKNGGQVYMDGANMNAQVGLTSPGFIGADVCHLNLHKTFCIPHGGGGPGMGPIGVAKHLAPFLPSHPVVSTGGSDPIGPISAAPWGSSLILTIPYVYLQLMGGQGLTLATKTAILNANYMAARLRNHYKVLFTGTNGFAAHEFIIDLRPFKAVGIEAEDIAKRLMDFNFHAPTMSFPIPGTLMIEPTESETKAELDRFCEAMIAIRREIQDVEDKKINVKDSPLKHAPHTAAAVCSDTWDRVYSRDQAAFPAPWVRQSKFWPAVGRVDNVYGDKNLMCSCPPLDSYSDE